MGPVRSHRLLCFAQRWLRWTYPVRMSPSEPTFSKTEKSWGLDGPQTRPQATLVKLLAVQRQELFHPPVALGMAGSVDDWVPV